MIEHESADRFYDEASRCYIFPFQLMDEKYGRIEIQIEPTWDNETGHVAGMYVSGRQTRDPLWKGRVYKIDNAKAEMLCGSALPFMLRSKDTFLQHVWMVVWCRDHGTVAMIAYPEDGRSKLIIPIGSSVMIDPYFE